MFNVYMQYKHVAWPPSVKMNISQKGHWGVHNIANLPFRLNINIKMSKLKVNYI